MNNLLLRAITGTIFVAVIIGAIWGGITTSTILLSIVTILSLNEFFNLFKGNKIIVINKTIALIVSTASFGILVSTLILDIIPNSINTLIILLFFLLFISELYRKNEQPIAIIGTIFLGNIYVITPFILALLILKNEFDASFLLMGMFILIWTNDTFAYLSGRFFGKTKLFERISPKKTWEGTIGGILFTIIVAVILSQFSDPRYSLFFWLISSLIIAPGAIFGDLFESLLKRSLNVKDSGKILPGHGGLLDRFDASLFTIPFFYCWMIIYSQF